ncbi:P-loop containing nucleoside triphosphate hydrolase protein [Rhizopogon vinicolor AM-OR11-026]|uniref:p-loop containing nucleoside triphosphate hydrolase protein n=1 Tax=Rhizopogon vinicolor AM-OR11-026 TaxID=1314800 RepID=A0A1B7N3Q1_9AGAM|nr:P-loop containing nucleoside triphosphate hydrolase protein [Rhizopogon vinicolor AM-OR11-026]
MQYLLSWTRRILLRTDTQREKTPFLERRLGVWRILIANDTSFRLPSLRWDLLSAHLPILTRACKDVYSISPTLFWLMMLSHLWYAIEDPLSLYFSNRLLLLIQRSISQGEAHQNLNTDLCIAIITRASCSAFTGFVRWSSKNVEDKYSVLVEYRLQERILRANLVRDLATSQDNEAQLHVDPGRVFSCLVRFLELGKGVISFLLQLRLLLHLLGSEFATAGPVSIILCFLPLISQSTMSDDIWSKAYVKQAVNRDYLRKEALTELARNTYKAEVMGGNLSEYLLTEYEKVHDALRNVPNGDIETLWRRATTALPDMFSSLCNDGPILYIGLLALANPSQVSVVQLAMLEQTASHLRWTFYVATLTISVWPGELASLKNFYRLIDLRNKMKDGNMPYSPAAGASGVSLEVRNVSFSYPSGKSERDALKDVSFSIKAGQLVVIVGTNGSGKSTILKLLTRSYDATSGTILVDGHPIQDYQIADLRSATANLTQEHTIFPLSLSENIGIGSPSSATNLDRISQAAKLAGAQGIVENFTEGYDTTLEPIRTAYLSYAARGNEALEAEYAKMDKATAVSGGEKQRLIAARTFMRMLSEDIKFVTVDEPSSALDPEGEYELFKQLREARKGRTMIFVTHRFGHLTRFADLVLCMKEGTVVETGTHQELMDRQGEYAHLYNVQAQAFT